MFRFYTHPWREGQLGLSGEGLWVGFMGVYGGVEVGVVVHFELAVELEAAFACEGLAPELVEAFGEV